MNRNAILLLAVAGVVLYFLFSSKTASAGTTVFTGSTAQPTGIGVNGGVTGLEAGIASLGAIFSGSASALAGPGQTLSQGAQLSTGVAAETSAANSPIQSNASIQDYLSTYSNTPAPSIGGAPSVANSPLFPSVTDTPVINVPAPTVAANPSIGLDNLLSFGATPGVSDSITGDPFTDAFISSNGYAA